MLTVRSLLDLREHCMSEFEFVDVYSNEKREENKIGLDLLKERCDFIENLEDQNKRWYEAFKGKFKKKNIFKLLFSLSC